MNGIQRRRQGGCPLGRFRDEMNDLFGRFLGDFGPMELSGGAWWPALDISEHDDKFTVGAELPGVESKDIDISVQGDVLTLSGEKKDTSEEKGEGYRYVERRYGSFHRSVQLPATVDPAKVDAHCKDGVLTIELAKSEQAKARKIEVKS